jgi:RNA polymerase sigma-70 factor, ECF subfamily
MSSKQTTAAGPAPFAAATDAELTAAVAQGDPAAQRELYDRHVERVYRLALRRCGARERASELTQSAFIRIFDRIHQFRGDAALSTWVHRVALSVMHSEMRSSARREARSLPLEVVEAPGHALARAAPAPSSDPWLRDRLQEAVGSLTERLRTVFLMHDLEGYTHEEIGRACGIALGTSKADLHRARRALRTRLSAYADEAA